MALTHMTFLFLDRQSSSEPMLRTYTLDSPIKNKIPGLGRQLLGEEHWLPFQINQVLFSAHTETHNWMLTQAPGYKMPSSGL